MKKLLAFTLILLSVHEAMSQDSIQASRRKHQLALSFYQPFKLNEPQGAGQFPPDMVVIFNGSDLKGSRFGLSLDYTYFMPNNKDFCFFRIGMTKDNRKDELSQEQTDYYGFETYSLTWDLDLKKTQMNLNLGYGRNFALSNQFSLDLGLSIASILEIKNELTFNYNEVGVYNDSTQHTVMQTSNYFQDHARWKHIGISPLIRPCFKIDEHWSISAEAQLMALFSFSTKKGRFESYYQYRDFDKDFEYSKYEDKQEQDTEFSGTFFSFSKIAPTLRVSYSF